MIDCVKSRILDTISKRYNICFLDINLIDTEVNQIDSKQCGYNQGC